MPSFKDLLLIERFVTRGIAKFQRSLITDIQKRIMLNLSAVLDAAGSSLENVLKFNIYLTNLKDFAEVNDAYITFIPGLKPASTP